MAEQSDPLFAPADLLIIRDKTYHEFLIAEQSDEIYGVNTINWGDSSCKHLPLTGDEQVISLLHTRVYVFSDSVLCLGKMNENPQSNICLGGQIDVVQKYIAIQSFGHN